MSRGRARQSLRAAAARARPASVRRGVDEACRGARRSAGAPGGSVAVGRLKPRLVDVTQLAPMLHGGRNRRNADFAVAIVEVLVVALGVLAQLRRPGRVHRSLQSILGSRLTEAGQA